MSGMAAIASALSRRWMAFALCAVLMAGCATPGPKDLPEAILAKTFYDFSKRMHAIQQFDRGGDKVYVNFYIERCPYRIDTQTCDKAEASLPWLNAFAAYCSSRGGTVHQVQAGVWFTGCGQTSTGLLLFGYGTYSDNPYSRLGQEPRGDSQAAIQAFTDKMIREGHWDLGGSRQIAREKADQEHALAKAREESEHRSAQRTAYQDKLRLQLATMSQPKSVGQHVCKRISGSGLPFDQVVIGSVDSLSGDRMRVLFKEAFSDVGDGSRLNSALGPQPQVDWVAQSDWYICE